MLQPLGISSLLTSTVELPLLAISVERLASSFSYEELYWREGYALPDSQAGQSHSLQLGILLRANHQQRDIGFDCQSAKDTTNGFCWNFANES
jgi:hypothetical protein